MDTTDNPQLENRLKEIGELHKLGREAVSAWKMPGNTVGINDKDRSFYALLELHNIAVEQAKEISDFRISLTDVLKVADSREKQIDELKADIDRLTRFIPVGERVPDHFREVLVECDISGTKMHKTASHYGDNRWDVDNVTGWREI